MFSPSLDIPIDPNLPPDKVIELKTSSYSSFIMLPQTLKNWPAIKDILKQAAEKHISKPEQLYQSIINIKKLVGGMLFDTFASLKTYLESEDPKYIENLLVNIIPIIASNALKIEHHYPSGKLPCLVQSKQNIVKFTSDQILSLISLCFFCALPSQQVDTLDTNFSMLYCSSSLPNLEVIKQKLYFFFAYFENSINMDKNSIITLTRMVLNSSDYTKLNTNYWMKCQTLLKNVQIFEGKIEDHPEASLVDFADSYIGGGNDHIADEEQILFLQFPQLFVSSMICEKMRDNEAIIIDGIEHISKSVGYGISLKFGGKIQDPLKNSRDKFGRIPRQIIAIDAVMCMQMIESHIKRDIAKAYLGFQGGRYLEPKESKPISTGRWGSGYFKGSSPIKFIIQWIAASEVGKELFFHPFGDPMLINLKALLEAYKSQTIGKLYRAVMKYMLDETDSMKQGNNLFDLLIKNKDMPWQDYVTQTP